MKKSILFLLLVMSMVINFASAATLHPKVKLLGIKAIKQSEEAGDELYLAITVYPSRGKPKHYYYPKRPLHWPSAHVDKIKPTHIWDKRLKQGDSVTVIIALIERDVPPWNMDDLVGEVELQMKNTNEGLVSRWSVLSRGAKGEINDIGGDHTKQAAVLNGRGGKYRVMLGLEK